MFLEPFGNSQQINLNWIISEIITLHKQLDPEYEAPSFSQIYPYSNLGSLNLDWILAELKAIKELAPDQPEIDIQSIAVALVALPYNESTEYQQFDYISRDGKIYRAVRATTGTYNSADWYETKLGTDLAVLDRWINAINASLNTAEDDIADIQDAIENLSSMDISDNSEAGGATVKASLDNLKGAITAKLIYNLGWEQGSISSTGVETINNARIRTIEYCGIGSYPAINISQLNSNYMFEVIWFDSDKQFLSGTGWKYAPGEVAKVTNAAYFRLLFAKRDSSVIDIDVASNIEISVSTTVKAEVGDALLKTKAQDHASAINELANKPAYDIEEPGTYELYSIICTGYTTTSGNYVDFFLPIRINPELTLSATYTQSGGNKGNTSVYTPTTVLIAATSMNTNISIENRSDFGLTFEIGFATTQEKQKPISIFINTLTISAT